MTQSSSKNEKMTFLFFNQSRESASAIDEELKSSLQIKKIQYVDPVKNVNFYDTFEYAYGIKNNDNLLESNFVDWQVITEIYKTNEVIKNLSYLYLKYYPSLKGILQINQDNYDEIHEILIRFDTAFHAYRTAIDWLNSAKQNAEEFKNYGIVDSSVSKLDLNTCEIFCKSYAVESIQHYAELLMKKLATFELQID